MDDDVKMVLAVIGLCAVLFGGLIGGLINSDVQTTHQMQLCIQAGKDWDGNSGNCIDK